MFWLGNWTWSSDLNKNWHGHGLYHLKQAYRRILIFSKFKMRALVKGPKSTKFDPTDYISAQHLDPVCPIWSKFGMDILLDHRNKPAEEFFIFIKIQDGCWRSKIEFRQNFSSKITFWLGKWILVIQFRPNLSGTCYLTLRTSLGKNF